MSAKLTPAQRKTLAWVRDNEPASQFPVAVNFSMVKKLLAMKLIETAGAEPGRFGFTRYIVSAAGHEALK